MEITPHTTRIRNTGGDPVAIFASGGRDAVFNRAAQTRSVAGDVVL